MKYQCIRCGDASSMFWYAYAVGCPPGSTVPEDGSTCFWLCDCCQAKFIKFLKEAKENDDVN